MDQAQGIALCWFVSIQQQSTKRIFFNFKPCLFEALEYMQAPYSACSVAARSPPYISQLRKQGLTPEPLPCRARQWDHVYPLTFSLVLPGTLWHLQMYLLVLLFRQSPLLADKGAPTLHLAEVQHRSSTDLPKLNWKSSALPLLTGGASFNVVHGETSKHWAQASCLPRGLYRSSQGLL